MTPLVAALALRVVVDQVDGGFAALELPDLSVVVLPVRWLGVPVSEGDALVLDGRRARRAPAKPRQPQEVQP